MIPIHWLGISYQLWLLSSTMVAYMEDVQNALEGSHDTFFFCYVFFPLFLELLVQRFVQTEEKFPTPNVPGPSLFFDVPICESRKD
ncbi:hypothetical protein Leryth_027174 [Lithospermum erythrorhizon]|nr:hypothetical protein Leryth_027174 [Lithospermum erythrorhizon]